MELDGIVTWADIDLDAVAFNVRQYQQHVGRSVELFAVVKANAYGHGAVQVARAACQAGAQRLAVHRAAEGARLRQAGLSAPILIMGHTPPGGADLIIEHGLTASLTTFETAQALSDRASAAGRKAPVHVKVDTGMSRYGLLPEEVLDFLHGLRRLPGIVLEGLYTHFATADAADQTHLRLQLAVFEAVLAAARQAGFEIPVLHACNSAAAMKIPQAHFDAIRPGIALYGMQPSGEWPAAFELRPALSLKSKVSRVRLLPAGTGISYGRTFITNAPTRVALVPIGYGDGYHRILSNQGKVLIGGQRAAILGRVCMDQIMVDVSHIPQVRQDDEVVLIGQQGREILPAEEVAALAGTINYEITTSILERVVRRYWRAGAVVEISGDPSFDPPRKTIHTT